MNGSKIESGFELFSRLTQRPTLENINPKLISNGPYPNEFVEIIGDAGTGKTSVLMDFILRTLLPTNCGGRNGGAILIDIEHKFDMFRLITMMERELKKTNPLNYKGIIMTCLKNLTVLNCYDSEQLQVTFYNLERILIDNPNVALISIDGIPVHYWQYRDLTDEHVSKHGYTRCMLRCLEERVQNNNVVVIFTHNAEADTKEIKLREEIHRVILKKKEDGFCAYYKDNSVPYTLVFEKFSQLNYNNDNEDNLTEDQIKDLVFQNLKVDDLEQHRLMTDCSINLLDDSDNEEDLGDAKCLNTTRVRESYKSILKEVYVCHPYHKQHHVESEQAITSTQDDLKPGENFAVSFRIYHPFRFTYSTTCYLRKFKPNSHTNLKFSQEIIALGSTRLDELRDAIKCSSDLGLCVEADELESNNLNIDPKRLYPSGFFFIDDTFYNDLRCPNSIDYSDVIRQWGRERDIAPLHVSSMATTQIKELTPRFGYPYVYVHQGNCEHIFVFSDAWVLSASDNLNSKRYPIFTGGHYKYSKLCHICGKTSAKWICLDSDRLPQDCMLFCNVCFQSYNYNDEGRVGNFKAYPYFNKV
ncbi:hypothetical protein FQR65_LT00140 [Abscondita terminalis]|nr:hypothetical protein FQR65_LT00140 [Abscondita terminalis]